MLFDFMERSMNLLPKKERHPKGKQASEAKRKY